MKTPDPAIDAIRKVRVQISEEHANNPARLVAHYIEYQRQFADRLLHTSSVGERLSDEIAAEQGNEPGGALQPAQR